MSAPTIGLPGATISEAIVVQELNANKLRVALGSCFERCITHFDEDSLPHHPGEKVCMDRCMAKLGYAHELSKVVKKQWDDRGKDLSPDALPKWIAALDAEHQHHYRHT